MESIKIKPIDENQIIDFWKLITCSEKLKPYDFLPGVAPNNDFVKCIETFDEIKSDIANHSTWS